MRRLLAILLVAICGLTTAAPLLAADIDLDAHLPACCRRSGVHHCAMASDTDQPSLSATCPECPRPIAAVPHAPLYACAETRATLPAPGFVDLAIVQAEQQMRLSRERTRHRRGPPTPFLTA